MDEQIQKNLYGWRAFHYGDGHLAPIWYNCIDAHSRASAITENEWMSHDQRITPYYFDLHDWNVADITPAMDMDDEEWIRNMPGSRVGLMRATQAGFHSFHYAADAVSYADTNHALIVGKVQVAGRVIEHESGYRSQFLRVIELYWRAWGGGTGSRIADELGWPFALKPFGEAISGDGGIIASFEEGFGDDG